MPYENIITKDNSLNLQLSYLVAKTWLEFKESYSTQCKITYNQGKVVNIYIVYEKNKSLKISSYPTLEN